MHKKKNFMSIVTVDHCQLVDQDFNRILRFTLDFAVEEVIPTILRNLTGDFSAI